MDAVWVAETADSVTTHYSSGTLLDSDGVAEAVVHLDAGDIVHVPSSTLHPRNSGGAPEETDGFWRVSEFDLARRLHKVGSNEHPPVGVAEGILILLVSLYAAWQ